ncbi:MAG TPA: PQQ-dependent dehydrogenase, methanol/ethanol family [Vicinamibacteria bacterium]|nr:PQQ-dependent dehydrogenase, methanol/ethanol family [Vicinamibacteria bacterium]
MSRSVVSFAAVFAFSAMLEGQVTYERLRNAEREPGHWLTYSGNYASHRFSSLDEIRRDNVARLRPTWIYQTQESGELETSPLVADGVMYFTEASGAVVALDVKTGRELWRWSRPLPKDLRTLGFPRTNRGLAILGETIYAGTLDARLVALDAVSGAVRWDANVADNELGYAITAAPLAIDGKIVMGVSGGEAGIRGFLDAYDAATGERIWRFHTVPGPGEPGNETWGGDSWKTGGGATWLTGSYDPESDLLIWGTGNPAPDWNGDSRPGDNLYTCSVVALHADSGTLAWSFQFTPHDVHDWDANQIPVLIEEVVQGERRKLVAMANRNAFYYLIDRRNGQFLRATPYAKQTWAKGIDEMGRPMLLPDKAPTEEGTLVWPSLQGATNWFSPSYSPRTKLLYVAVREMGSYYFKAEAEYERGEYFMGGGERALRDEAYGAIRALDIATGETKWEFKQLTPPWAGVLSTAGDLVFAGSEEGNFFALDANTGEPLWQFQTGGDVRANPIAFEIDGKQHIGVAAGRAIFVFGL